jgi:glycosyltransferase involved in cell wall biosynthesis
MSQMRFHVVGLPHTQTHKKHTACAFTEKIRKFCIMMRSLGHTVFHYGAEGSEADCNEHITIITAQEQEQFFGPFNPDKLYSIDWTGQARYWPLTNDRAAVEINKRAQAKDFVCLVAGGINISLASQLSPNCMAVEPFIGYNGVFAKYRVFESQAHMHKIWGAEGGYDPDGKFYDAVVPNYFDSNDLPLQTEKKDYYLYLGRLIQRKGINIAVDTCNQLGAKLIIAGQGCAKLETTTRGKRLTAEDGQVYEGDIGYVGCVIGQQKADLFGHAKATFVPTRYIEPFGGVAVESQMCGTPAITTDFGAFPETVEHGKTGFRCRTLNEFVQAAKAVSTLDPIYIHQRAVRLYSMKNVRHQFDTYFRNLLDLWEPAGWGTIRPEPDKHWLRT